MNKTRQCEKEEDKKKKEAALRGRREMIIRVWRPCELSLPQYAAYRNHLLSNAKYQRKMHKKIPIFQAVNCIVFYLNISVHFYYILNTFLKAGTEKCWDLFSSGSSQGFPLSCYDFSACHGTWQWQYLVGIFVGIVFFKQKAFIFRFSVCFQHDNLLSPSPSTTLSNVRSLICCVAFMLWLSPWQQLGVID